MVICIVPVQPKCLKSRGELREQVNVPPTSTWRRCSLTAKEPAAKSRMCLRAGAEAPGNCVALTGTGPWNACVCS